MRVTIDLEREIVIIPDNFFVKIKADNERLEKFGAIKTDAEKVGRSTSTVSRVREYEAAMRATGSILNQK